MTSRVPIYLVLAGSLMLVVGIASTVTLVMRRDHCTADASVNSSCQGYTPTIHWSYLIVLFGAACFVAAALFDHTGKRVNR